jgi:hypothetical protein
VAILAQNYPFLELHYSFLQVIYVIASARIGLIDIVEVIMEHVSN